MSTTAVTPAPEQQQHQRTTTHNNNSVTVSTTRINGNQRTVAVNNAFDEC
jgi:hypothetical protein